MMAFGTGMFGMQTELHRLKDRCAKLEVDNAELKESNDCLWEKVKVTVENGNKLREIMMGIRQTITEMQSNGTVEKRTGSAQATATAQSTEQGKKKEEQCLSGENTPFV
jgi:hypothetical protein